ncbi:MAG: DUF454 domain-containing protein [Crenarchaeota archaeon]|nr:DUF454 domain-containing protein [Thermoproteota archaeon]
MSQPVCRKTRIKNSLFVIVGTIFVGLGAIGMVLPILPTTPFLLLAAACYIRGSKRMYKWLFTNRWCGSYLKNYYEGRGISARGKFISIVSLWVAIAVSTFMVNIIFMQIGLFLIATVVSIHLIRVPTYRKDKKMETQVLRNKCA